MQFSTLIFKNILRRKTRSAFTVLGISIGIATIIALGAVMQGMTVQISSAHHRRYCLARLRDYLLVLQIYNVFD